MIDFEKTSLAEIIVLGSGTSTGVPILGCSCAVCKSQNPFNKRTRASVALRFPDNRYAVIDTGPDFRTQMLREGISRVDAVLYTHTHADHVNGFDDLRALSFTVGNTIPIYVAKQFADRFRNQYQYVFGESKYRGAIPKVELIEIPDEGSFDLFGIEVDCARVEHGSERTSVFRLGDFCYATDFKKFPEELIARWRGKIKIMIASGVHFGFHETHSVIQETVQLMEDLEVEQGFITHISHLIDHEKHSSRLPSQIKFAFDGLRLSLATSN